ncbi:MAG TPA: bifunctional phosphoribosyl-AMP cyclohydrolase/phosphoribosyl-ATP diphosphatase HisIE [Pyrinomonadaceae bacterium]|jgi:phosphoribosyl-ATP pyrophosphohydrolase/phosphoribosyl-AMP cyclohydrolase|nr:bifunctional phosphoribosyl-AMP cyclohydrolase/phosphoribosyl-ATP diphosphatase HisIE [Pyrinomonadaceae bacterium]
MKWAIEDLKFDERGLVPAVVQDARTGEVLTLAYMNAESLRRTLDTRETWFWSRSRSALWHKGETSGHTQRVVGIRLDCDGDALVVSVEPGGPACHTGARTCFHNRVAGASFAQAATGGAAQAGATLDAPVETGSRDTESRDLGALLSELYRLVETRRRERPAGSYTTYLFDEGLDKILKKVGEESAETIIAAKNEDTQRLASEVSDLLYHLLVLLVERGVALDEIRDELARRAGGRDKSSGVADVKT